MDNYSDLQKERCGYQAPLPKCFTKGAARAVTVGTPGPVDPLLAQWLPKTLSTSSVKFVPGDSGVGTPTPSSPLRVGIVFCGRQCPGGHNVVAGVLDALAVIAPGSTLLGFVGGTLGLFEGKTMTLTPENVAPFRNQGGYTLLGRSVDRIHSASECAAVHATVTSLGLSGLILLGGTFTNGDAAHLGEYLAARGAGTRVVGVPCTIDGDMRGPGVGATLGFDTACKVTAGLMGNLETDCLSAKKYLYFVRVLGREQGHMALEVALQSRPNLVLLGEDVGERGLTLTDVVREVADCVSARAAVGKQFAVVLLSEGLPHYIPELRSLLREIDAAFAAGVTDPATIAASHLSPWSAAVLAYLPPAVRPGLFLERESNGRAQLSQIATERLLVDLVNDELVARRAAGTTKAKGGNGMGFFFGYQARSAMPTNFDCALGGALGASAAHLVAGGFTGYLATVLEGCGGGVEGVGEHWVPGGVPLASLLTVPLAGAANPPPQTRTRVNPASNSSPSLASPAAAATAPAAAPATAPATGGSGAAAAPGFVPGAVVPLPLDPATRPIMRSVPVDVRGAAFRSFRGAAGGWASGDLYCNPGPVQFKGSVANQATMCLEAEAAQQKQ